MIKFHFILLTLMLALFGCNPFNVKQVATQQFIDKANKTSQKINRSYKAQIRQIKPYQIYRYQETLSDPFRGRSFMLESTQEVAPVVTSIPQCSPPNCVPPEPHTPTLLENYGLDALKFVGTLTNNRQVGLIRTPDYGVVEVKIGEYMGRNNGKVIAINKSSIVLQEKLLKNGLWKNKKTVLVIRR